MKTLTIAVLFTALAFGAKEMVTVRTIRHITSETSQTYTQTTPGRITTNCGVGTCETTDTPPRTEQYKVTQLWVTEIVQLGDMQYKLTCYTGWRACTWLEDGQTFMAEMDAHAMWIIGHLGGNRGKQVRIKYQILDVRPVQP